MGDGRTSSEHCTGRETFFYCCISASGEWQLPVAPGYGESYDAAAALLADEGTENHTDEGEQSGARPERELIWGNAENTGF